MDPMFRSDWKKPVKPHHAEGQAVYDELMKLPRDLRADKVVEWNKKLGKGERLPIEEFTALQMFRFRHRLAVEHGFRASNRRWHATHKTVVFRGYSTT